MKHLIRPEVDMKVTKINTNINFKENRLSREMNSQDAILMLRDPNAAVKFQKSQEYARKADSIDSNPITSLGYKLYRAFKTITDKTDNNAENTQLNTVA